MIRDESIYVALTNVQPARPFDQGRSVALLDQREQAPGSFKTASTTTVTIVDDGDAGALQFTSSHYYGREDAGHITVTITREGGKSTSCCTKIELKSRREIPKL